MCEMTHSQVSGLRTRAAIVPCVSLGALDVAATFIEGIHEPQTPRDFTSRSAFCRKETLNYCSMRQKETLNYRSILPQKKP